MEAKKVLIELLKESIDLKKLVHGLVDNLLEEALKEYVAKTANVIDDAAMAMIYPKLEEFALEFLDKKIDELLDKLA